MDHQTAGSDAGILGAGNEAIPRGQSVEAISAFGNGDGTAPQYHHQFDPNCVECRRQAYERLREEISTQPLPWESIDPTIQFYELPRPNMHEENFFASLSDFEDVTYFNQPYLAQYRYEERQQQQQQQQQHPFPTLLALDEEQQSAIGLRRVPDEAIEPLLFQQVTGAEAFEPTTFQSTAFEPTVVEPLAYMPATIEPTMFGHPMALQPTFLSSTVEASTLEPMEFNFNTLPHGPMQHPIVGEPWASTHDGGLFETKTDECFKRQASVEGCNMISSAASQAAETNANAHNRQNPIHYEPSVNQTPVRAPRRLLPSNGHRQRPVHRQPEARTRRLPALHSSSEAGSERAAKDLFLVQSRHQGLSYKEIKRLGKFTEAESTLRGRYRTLTKDKKDRVRDPKWTEVDIHLLKEAVRVLGHGLHPDRAKLSWMAVSKYISNHGGSYGFGYSTCHRRWTHLEATGQLSDNGYDDSWVDDDDEAETLADAEEEYGEGADEKTEVDDENADEEDQDTDMVDDDEEESEEEKLEDSQMVEKDKTDECESSSESDDDDDDDDDNNGVTIKTETKTEE
ncbi:hypothetical protein V8C35DRAFT_279437 [Trichoderma chlorosporum]